MAIASPLARTCICSTSRQHYCYIATSVTSGSGREFARAACSIKLSLQSVGFSDLAAVTRTYGMCCSDAGSEASPGGRVPPQVHTRRHLRSGLLGLLVYLWRVHRVCPCMLVWGVLADDIWQCASSVCPLVDVRASAKQTCGHSQEKALVLPLCLGAGFPHSMCADECLSAVGVSGFGGKGRRRRQGGRRIILSQRRRGCFSQSAGHVLRSCRHPTAPVAAAPPAARGPTGGAKLAQGGALSTHTGASVVKG